MCAIVFYFLEYWYQDGLDEFFCRIYLPSYDPFVGDVITVPREQLLKDVHAIAAGPHIEHRVREILISMTIVLDITQTLEMIH